MGACCCFPDILQITISALAMPDGMDVVVVVVALHVAVGKICMLSHIMCAACSAIA